ncbi:hypothetical protein F5Y01DRAFT_327100 [Xylaria sp. FL0043]|nr:hypothetical protein F5Y01DRAFT_327100 [Xylaria sp. FL0043]
MEVIAAIVAWAVQLISQPSNMNNAPFDIQNLTGRLSSGAHIYLPKSSGFEVATTRWSTFDTPTFRLVVAPSTENDVAEVVKYANELNVPFLAVTGAHGAITTVGNLHDGIGIWMSALNSVEINHDGSTVTIGGGTLSKSVTDTLWAAGKQTVTGICECTSILGPGLGGGHGALQGRYGLISDQFVSMNVVLADGTLVTVNDTEHSDLWWAMRGAGHNFGIVTSLKSRIYDIQHQDWAYQSFIYTGEKTAGLFETINKNFPRGNQDVEVLHLVIFINNYDVDPTKPLAILYVLQEGVSEVDAVYTSSFQGLEPIMTTSGSGPYPDLPTWIGENRDAPSCQKIGQVNIRFPIDLEFYNVTAVERAYDLFSTTTQKYPVLNNSIFLFEGYSLQGVREISSASTAYPFRQDNYLVSPLITYASEGSEIHDTAINFGENLRAILHAGSDREELHTYVNYAFGNEKPQNWYGYEQWRQGRLSALKKRYDPLSRFNFYGPIGV